MTTINVKHNVERLEDGRIASSIAINGESATTRYYDNATFLFVGVRGLLNVFNTFPNDATVHLTTNIYNIKDILTPAHEMTMKTRQLLLDVIAEKNLTIEL